MRTYELLYIIPATLTDEEVGQTESDIQALVTKYGGTPKESRRLGKFKLAYLIKKVRHGHYVLVYFEAESDAIAKINEAMRIHDRVLRHMILRADEAGGSEFNLVQFQEVVVDAGKDDRSKRRNAKDKTKVADDVKEAAALDEDSEKESDDDEDVKKPEDVKEAVEEVKVSDEELDRKIDAALSEQA
ncbi:30S ribosomal protein S6 [Patescibacteria group bacterium]|nr:30S ribosomal protein S6 [Patescibacteria group bacterium]